MTESKFKHGDLVLLGGESCSQAWRGLRGVVINVDTNYFPPTVYYRVYVEHGPSKYYHDKPSLCPEDILTLITPANTG